MHLFAGDKRPVQLCDDVMCGGLAHHSYAEQLQNNHRAKISSFPL
jgi:hypothetical protein